MAGKKDVPRRWWLPMIVCSAALAAFLLGAYFLTPAMLLDFHVWRWRSGGGGDSFKRAAEMIVVRRLKRDAVVGLLGEPHREDADRLTYLGNPTAKGSPWWRIGFEDGRAASVIGPPRAYVGPVSIALAIQMYAEDCNEIFPNAGQGDCPGGTERK